VARSGAHGQSSPSPSLRHLWTELNSRSRFVAKTLVTALCDRPPGDLFRIYGVKPVRLRNEMILPQIAAGNRIKQPHRASLSDV